MTYKDPEQYRPDSKNDGSLIDGLFDAVGRAEEAAKIAPKPKSLVEQAWDRLYSSTCVCGQKKEIKKSFCRFCYYELPRKLRLALWTPMPAYAEEYDKACKWIEAHRAERKQRADSGA